MKSATQMFWHEFWHEFWQAARQGPRLYFAPLVGAARAVREEFASFEAVGSMETSVRSRREQKH